MYLEAFHPAPLNFNQIPILPLIKTFFIFLKSKRILVKYSYTVCLSVVSESRFCWFSNCIWFSFSSFLFLTVAYKGTLEALSSSIRASRSCHSAFFSLASKGLSSFLLHIYASSFSGTELCFPISHWPSLCSLSQAEAQVLLLLRSSCFYTVHPDTCCLNLLHEFVRFYNRLVGAFFSFSICFASMFVGCMCRVHDYW